MMIFKKFEIIYENIHQLKIIKIMNFNNFFNKYNILVDNTNELFIKVTDCNSFSVFESQFDHNILQEIGCVQSLNQLYTLVCNAFNNIEGYSVTISHKQNKLLIMFDINLTEYYNIQFTLKLFEQENTSDKQNQMSILKIERRIDVMMRDLEDRLKQLQNKVDFNEGILEQSSIVVGTGNFQNIGNYVPIYVELCVRQLTLNITCGGHCSYSEKSNVILTTPYWEKFKYLYNLKNLTANMASHIPFTNDTFAHFNNGSLESITIGNYNSATLEGIENIPTLKTVHIQSSTSLKNASDYIKNLPELKKIQFSGCEGIKTNDKAQLDAYCNKKKIELIIS